MNLKKISEKFGIPYRTVFRWRDGWRRKLLEYLSNMDFLEKEAEHKIRTLFKENELEAIISSLNGTIPTEDMFKIENAFEMRIEDSFLYEPMVLLSYKPDDIELEDFKNILINKLKKLCQFERYVLFGMCKERWVK